MKEFERGGRWKERRGGGEAEIEEEVKGQRMKWEGAVREEDVHLFIYGSN